MAPESPLLAELKDKFAASWLRGAAWRLEQGELLSQIKEECDHGQWGEFLKEYDIPRSTADDYIRRWKDEVQITEPRQFEDPNPEPQPDHEAKERATDIEVEKKKREGKQQQHNQSEVTCRVRNLLPNQTAVYWEERKENQERVDAIWRAAFFQIIGEVTSVATEEELSCSAS
jgi:hypothetical protein